MECEVCSNLASLALLPGQRVAKIVSLASLREATRCAECILIRDALRPLKAEWDERDLRSTAELLITRDRALQVRWPRGSVALELFTRDGDTGARHPGIGTLSEVSERSDSESSFQLAAAWLQDCMTNHELCKDTIPVALPTRVIDVGKDGEQDPFLVVTDGRRGSYAALTYCWGNPLKHRILKTTSDNFEKHLSAIALQDMPRTLCDAVIICRRLGLQYLWIDALCIIQGDDEDWAREAGKMCDVYSNAALTIAADHGDGNSAGILGPQEYGERPRKLSLNGRRAVYVREFRKHNDVTLLYRSPDAEEDALTPINQRAWTLQEALLSKRILHYTADEMVWECTTRRECECRLGRPVALDDSPTRLFRNVDLFRTLTLAGAYQEWRNLLPVFAERRLSFDDDKLSALSGMADQFSRMCATVFGITDRYLAGLWEGDLPRGLLWTVEDDSHYTREQSFRRPRAWRAPSWSWAAVEAPIALNPRSNFQSALTLIKATVELLNDADPYGRLRKAEIVLRGRIIHGFGVKITAARPYSPGREIDGMKYEIVDSIDRSRPVDFDDVSAARSGGPEYSCLLIGTSAVRGAIFTHHAFLVLRRTGADPDARIFERVGMSSYQGDWSPAGTDMFANCPEETITII
ncbi:heterokaryon incompatibility protein [Podospora didyma]|uniref:Heterokaryon incompatibility protein n=1 Tax=Podospora didyma TaxID=330526 RepID=A0AAE0N9B1_9PEZI|nr:heterokaryon incompatibility protein [Podospora didyma]